MPQYHTSGSQPFQQNPIIFQEELRESLGMKKNSTWRNMVARFVNSYKIAYYPEPKTIRMTKKMFPVVPRPGPDDRNEK